VPNVLNHVRNGRLRALGVTSAKRWPDLPDVPTIAEAGVPGYDASLWLGMMAPAGTPAPIIDRLANAIGTALHDPTLIEQLHHAGIAPEFMGPKDFGAFMRAEYDKWGRVVQQTGATVN
jgi:tripartite-type tricarboxylate transporter receptor subunit TctC